MVEEQLAQEPIAADPPAGRARMRQLYGYLREQKIDVPDDYQVFEDKLIESPERQKQLYDLLKGDEVDVPESVDAFSSALTEGLKKKDLSAPSSPIVGTSDGTPLGSVPGLASGVLGTGLPDQEFTQPSVLEDVPRISPRSAVQQAPGDNYIAAGINPTMEQLRADEAAKQPQPEAADVADDGFWASFGKSLYNGLDLKRIGGNLLDYGGDLVESLANNTMYDDYGNRLHEVSDLGKPITDNKTSDVMARDLLGRAQASDLPISQAAQQSILSNPSLASAGNLLGSGAASIVPVAAASMLGGPVAGAGVGAGLGISATKDAARQAGIGDEEAMVTATILAPIQGVLESLGVKDPGIAKLAVRATLREALAAGEGKLTREGLAFASKKILPEVAKRFAAGAKHEGLTEFLQGEAEGAGKLIADKVRGNEDAPAGQGRYGVSAFDALVKSPIEQTIAGIALGGGIGTTHGGGTQVASQEAIQSPLQASEAPVDERTFSVRRPTGQVEMENVRVHAVSADGKTAVVRGVDAQGSPIEREVPTDSLREDANKNNASPPSPLPQGEGVQPQVRAIPLGQSTDGRQLTADVDAEGNPVRVYDETGKEFPLDNAPAWLGEILPQAIQEYEAAQQADMNVGQSPAADPSIIDVTDQAPEPIAPEPTPAPEGGTQDVAPAEPSPTEPPAPVTSPPDADTGTAPAPVDRTAEREAAQAAVDEYNDGDTATRKGLTGVQQRQAIQELADKAGMSVELDEKSKATLVESGPARATQNVPPSAANEPASTEIPQNTPNPAPTGATLEQLSEPAKKERQHPKGYDAETQAGLTEDQRFYTPRKRIQNATEANEYIDEHGLENAYKAAISPTLVDAEGNSLHGAVQDEIRAQVRTRLLDAAVEADKAGNQNESARLLQQASDVLGQRSQSRTETAQALAQYQSDVTKNPDVALDDYIAGVAEVKKKVVARNERKGNPADKTATKRRKAKVEKILADEAVQAAADAVAQAAVTGDEVVAKPSAKPDADPKGWGSNNKYFKTPSAKEAREALRKLGLSSIIPPEVVQFLGFHIEAGARSFSDVSKKAVRDLGQRVKPLLPEAYEKAKQEFIKRGGDANGFDGPDGVEAALRSELAQDLAARLIDQVRPVKSGAFDPVKQMLNTLTKRVGETLPEKNRKPVEAREALAAAINNRREYLDVLNQSKDAVLKQIAELKIPDATKQEMVDTLTDFMEQANGRAYAEQQFRRSVKQAEDAVVGTLPGKNRREQYDYLAKASEEEYLRIVGEMQDHVTKGVEATDAEAVELREAVAEEINRRALVRRRAIRAQGGVYEEGQSPEKKSPERKSLPERLTALLAARATNEQVARRLAPEAVTRGIKELKTTMERLVREHADVREAAAGSLVDKLVTEAGLTPEQAEVFAKVVRDKFNQNAETKAQGLVARILAPAKAKLPGGKARTVVDRLTESLDLADATGEGPSPAAALLNKMAGLPEVTAADVEQFRKLADKVREASKPKTVTIKGKAVEAIDTKAREKAVIDLLHYGSGKFKGQTWWDMPRAVQYAFRLSGPDTHGRNIKANVLHTLMEQGIVTPLYNKFKNKSIAGAAARGYIAAQGTGLAEAAYTLSTGYASGPAEKFGNNAPLESTKNKFWAAWKYVGRLMVAEDQLTSVPTENSRTFEVALQRGFEIARRKVDANGNLAGLKGQELRDQAWAEANEILYNTKEALDDISTVVDEEGLPSITPAQVKSGEFTAQQAAQRAVQRSIRTADLLRQARAADNPELVSEAQEYARVQTLNNDPQGQVGRLIDALQGLKGSGKNTNLFADIILSQLVPFMRIPANSMARKLEWGLPILTAGRIFAKNADGSRGRTSLTLDPEAFPKYSRALTSEERWKMGIRASVGAAGWISLLALARSGAVIITGPPTGDDEDGLYPPQSIILSESTPLLGKTVISYKDSNLEYPLTIMAALSKFIRKNHKKGVDKSTADLIAVAAIHSGAWMVTQGPFNGPSDLAASMEKTMQGNTASAENYFKRLLVNTVKTGAVPAVLNQSGQIYREWTGAAQREKGSNSFIDEMKVSFFGNNPFASVGEDRINFLGEPVVLGRNGLATWADQRSHDIAELLVGRELLPDRQAPTDDKLALYDPKTGDRVTPLSNKEFHDYVQRRGKAFKRELFADLGDGDTFFKLIKNAATDKEARKFRDAALAIATREALTAAEEARANKAVFRLSQELRNQDDAANYRQFVSGE